MTGSVVGVFVERVVVSDGLAEVVTGRVEIVVEVAGSVVLAKKIQKYRHIFCNSKKTTKIDWQLEKSCLC